MNTTIAFRCSECGGEHVEFAVWYNPNTRVVDEAFHDPEYQQKFGSGFCHDCGDHVNVVELACPHEHPLFARPVLKRLRAELGVCEACDAMLDGDGRCNAAGCRVTSERP